MTLDPTSRFSTASADEALSIIDFLTDGSLPRLCEAGGRLLDRPVLVMDALGSIIESNAPSQWSLRQPTDAERVLLDDPEHTWTAPIRAGAHTLGHIAVPRLASDSGSPSEEGARELFSLIAQTVGELCENELAQRSRADELQALYRLSSMLVGVASVRETIDAGLRSALELLRADAGLVRLLDEQNELRSAASVVEGVELDVESLPTDEKIDQAALACSVVEVNASDDGALAIALRQAGLQTMLRAGLTFRGRAIGTISLFFRSAGAEAESRRSVLESIAQQLAAAVASANLIESERRAHRMRQQVELAADVQRRMLPERMPARPGIDIAARFRPCFELGGDFYDLFDLGESVGLAIGDVSGKGFAAALLMSHVRASLRAHARDLYDLDEIMARVNQALSRDTLENEFATVFYSVIDPATLRLTYCNAGHDPPIISHRCDGGPRSEPHLSELTTGGMVVGVDANQRYQRGLVELRPGDVLLAHTDGLPDAINFEGQRFGKQRVRESLLTVLNERPDASASEIAHHIHWRMRRFAGLTRRADDLTIVTLRVTDDALDAARVASS